MSSSEDKSPDKNINSHPSKVYSNKKDKYNKKNKNDKSEKEDKIEKIEKMDKIEKNQKVIKLSIIDNVLLNLKIISEIKAGDKISLNDKIINIDRSSYLQFLTRWYNESDRNIGLDHINLIINEAFIITDKILSKEFSQKDQGKTSLAHEENSHLLQRFLRELNNSCKGLSNLKNTYSDDITVTSCLELLIEKIKIKTEGFSKVLKIYV